MENSKGDIKILECSSKGNKRFSAFYAKVKVFGKYTNIERHYQSCKRKYDSNGIFVLGCAKGETPDFIVINGKKLDKKYLTPYYKLLWCKYLDENPDLVEYAKQYDDYNDIFKGKSINCQADVIRQYIKKGRASIIEDCKELIQILKESR